MTSPPRGLFLTDLDGTLLGPDGNVPERNLEALRRAQEAGIALAIVTGRRRSTIRREHARLAGLRYRVAASNGAVVLAPDHETPERVLSLPWDAVRQLEQDDSLREARILCISLPERARAGEPEEHDCAVLAAGDRAAFSVESAWDPSTFRPVDRQALDRRALVHVALHVTGRDVAEAHAAAVQQAFGTSAEVHVVVSPRGAGFLLEAAPPGGKGAAAVHLAESLGVPSSRIGAIGDEMNDSALLDRASHRFAVGGSVLAQRRPDATEVVRAEDGAVADALGRFVALLPR